MTEVKKGIKETKEVLDFAFGIAIAVKKSLADGKIDALDAGHLISIIGQVSPAFSGIKDVLPEMKDLDSAEIDELLAFAAEKLKGVMTHKPDQEFIDDALIFVQAAAVLINKVI